MQYTRVCATKIRNYIIMMLVKEARKMIDTKEIKVKYKKRKFRHKWNIADVDAKNSFTTKFVRASLIKYTNRLNHYRLRH